MTILWQLSNSTSCTLKWGLTPACTTGSVSTTEKGTDASGHQHIFTLSNLMPAKHYYYQVIENGVTHSGFFRSAPPDTADSTSFFIYGDTRSYPERHDSVMASICQHIQTTPSCQTLILHTGDWNSSSYESAWELQYFSRAYPKTLEALSKIPVLGTRGNHEVSGDQTLFKKYWPYPYESKEWCYYAFDYGPVHVSVVDQYTNYSPGTEQYQWLENDLAQSDKQWKFILLHEPGFSDVGAHDNNYDVQAYLQPLCRKYNVQAVFSGHNHFYARCVVADVHHMTTGGGGAPLYSVSQAGEGLITSETCLHHIHARIQHDSAVFTAIRTDGTVIEHFSINETPWPDPEPPVPEIKMPGRVEVYLVYHAKMLTIRMNHYRNATLSILNISGKVGYRRKLTKSLTTIDLSLFQKGIYFVRIAAGNSVIPTKIILF